MVNRARELVTDTRVTFEVGDGVSLRSRASSEADLIVSFTVFQHLPSAALVIAYIEEAGRVLKPGGVFAFQWNNEPNARRWRLRRQRLVLQRRLHLPGAADNRFAHEFLGSRVPLPTVVAALDAAGLELEATQNLDTLYAWAWARKPY